MSLRKEVETKQETKKIQKIDPAKIAALKESNIDMSGDMLTFGKCPVDFAAILKSFKDIEDIEPFTVKVVEEVLNSEGDIVVPSGVSNIFRPDNQYDMLILTCKPTVPIPKLYAHKMAEVEVEKDGGTFTNLAYALDPVGEPDVYELHENYTGEISIGLSLGNKVLKELGDEEYEVYNIGRGATPYSVIRAFVEDQGFTVGKGQPVTLIEGLIPSLEGFEMKIAVEKGAKKMRIKVVE